jgi:hypothetical protein
MNIKESNTKKWTGTHRGVGFEINNFKTPAIEGLCSEQDNWTYYLFIHLSRIPKANNPETFWLKSKPDDNGRVYYKYYEHSVINNIDLSGGCTWYSKELGFDGSDKVIKIGCDYAHIWNTDYERNLENIKCDVENSINKFRELIPDYKYWCGGNGKLYSESEGIIKDEAFCSKEYWGDKDWFKELEKENLRK